MSLTYPLGEAESWQAPEWTGARRQPSASVSYKEEEESAIDTGLASPFPRGSGLVPYETCHKQGPQNRIVTWVAVPFFSERRKDGRGIFPWHLPHDYPAIALLPLCSLCPPPRMPSPVQPLEIPLYFKV